MRPSRLSGPLEPSSHRLLRSWRWRGGPCNHPELLGSFWDPAAVEICPAAAAADPHGDPQQRDRPAASDSGDVSQSLPQSISSRTTCELVVLLAGGLCRCPMHGFAARVGIQRVRMESPQARREHRWNANGADDVSLCRLVTPNIERASSQSAQRSSSTAKLRRAQSCASETERAIASRSR